MNYFNKKRSIVAFLLPNTKLLLLGMCSLLIALFTLILRLVLKTISFNIDLFQVVIEWLVCALTTISRASLIIGAILIVTAITIHFIMPDKTRIKYMVRKVLCSYEYGNPLNLKDGERLPKIKCEVSELGVFTLTVKVVSCTVENMQNITSSISSALNKKRFANYAVTQTDTDISFNNVKFRIEDVTQDLSLTFNEVKKMKQTNPATLAVQKNTYIDLRTSGSILCAGKTRSGKTTGIISLLIQSLLYEKDNFDSKIIIIDPKQAELSRLPTVVTLDKDGEAKGILKAMQMFSDIIVKRQQTLNTLSEKTGDAVKWWDAGMHASFIFIDEYVSCRTMFPSKPSKNCPTYCLATFDSLLKRIVTMGASAGCFAIISIAEASVSEGGLPAMLRSAMTTKILFKPTLDEGRLIWDSDKLKDFNNGRVYNAGDAWFSSTDGLHDRVSFVHFPRMTFKVYAELGRLLNKYHS